jgi:hypothetical protein
MTKTLLSGFSIDLAGDTDPGSRARQHNLNALGFGSSLQEFG